MAPTPTASAEPVHRDAGLRALHRQRRALLIQAPWLFASAALLVLGAGRLEGAGVDLQFLFLAVAGVFSLAAVHFVDELCTLLGHECPRCARSFFGEPPESLPSPLRRRCHHCGQGLPGVAAARRPRSDAR